MESSQCLEDQPSAATVTQELCLPTRGTVVRHISSVARRSGIRNVFVASDSDPDVPHLQQELGTSVSMVNVEHCHCMIQSYVYHAPINVKPHCTPPGVYKGRFHTNQLS